MAFFLSKVISGRNEMVFGVLNSIGVLVLFFHSPAMAQGGEKSSPGRSLFSVDDRVEYIVGNLPVIISVPHGGKLAPRSVPDRNYGIKQTDGRTDDLGREIAQAFFKLTGNSPHIIICHLKRSKVDCNRPLKEAAQGNGEARRVWEGFHQMIGEAQRKVSEGNEIGLYIDLHGHAHPAAHLELGYLISNSQLKKSDKDLAALQQSSSLRFLKKPNEASFIEVLKGETSFGGLMQQHGFTSVPSPEHPDPGGGKFFSGGYNTRRYCLQQDGRFFGFQLECPNKVRNSETNRKSFSDAFVHAVIEYLRLHTNFHFGIATEGPTR